MANLTQRFLGFFKKLFVSALIIISLPLIGLLLFSSFWRSRLYELANGLLQEAKNKDEALKKENERLRRELEQSKAKVNDIDNKILDIRSKQDKDWHLKK